MNLPLRIFRNRFSEIQKYTKGIQKSMLTTVSCLLLCGFDSIYKKKKIQPEDYMKHE